MPPYNVTIELTDLDQRFTETARLLSDEAAHADGRIAASMQIMYGQGGRVAKALGIPVELISIDDIERLIVDAHVALKLERLNW